jgi:hypothetical protein
MIWLSIAHTNGASGARQRAKLNLVIAALPTLFFVSIIEEAANHRREDESQEDEDHCTVQWAAVFQS